MLKLVIPAYREVGRLPAFLSRLVGELADAGLACEVLVVDDGSPPAEQQALQAEVDAIGRESAIAIGVLHHAENRGKGHAVRSGWAGHDGFSHLAFVDADGAIPPRAAADLFRRAMEDAGDRDCWVGSRRAGSEVQRNPVRHMISMVFAAYARACLRVPVHDYQCGIKVVRTEAYARVARLLRMDRFAFDSELLAFLHADGARIAEVAVPWSEKAGRRWPLLPAALEMARDIWRIRKAVRRRGRG